ncbi:MAG TPA: BON domain-containing protein [Steroidobacter sp.]|jgi:osmotically-inducible protein OsmY|nr:BON domain-containing protein [Steroidobacteraceae bacterium]HLS80356.1 BON domain-containing protein [Steroidobacter sp.]
MTEAHRRASSIRAAPGLSLLLAAAVLGAALAGCAPTPTQQPAEEAIEDGVLTAKVKIALADDPLTSAQQISVSTHKGEVQLSGLVHTQEARNRALRLARDVHGVRRVRDALQVSSGGDL